MARNNCNRRIDRLSDAEMEGMGTSRICLLYENMLLFYRILMHSDTVESINVLHSTFMVLLIVLLNYEFWVGYLIFIFYASIHLFNQIS